MSHKNELLPVYELTLKSNEPLASSTSVVRLNDGDSAIVRCSIGDSGYEPGTLYLSKNHKNITADASNSNAVSYRLANYSKGVGTINFDCSAKRRSGKYQLRSLRVTPKSTIRLPSGVKECEVNHCKNGGQCVTQVDHNTSYCICVDNFTGSSCERLEGVLIEGLNKDAACAYVGSLVLFLFVLLFGSLYFRERRKRIRSILTEKPAFEHSRSTYSDGSLDNYDFLEGPKHGYTSDLSRTCATDEENGLIQKRPLPVGCGTYDNLPTTPTAQARIPRNRLNAISDSSEIDDEPLSPRPQQSIVTET